MCQKIPIKKNKALKRTPTHSSEDRKKNCELALCMKDDYVLESNEKKSCVGKSQNLLIVFLPSRNVTSKPAKKWEQLGLSMIATLQEDLRLCM